jgi:hypothetical protein
MPQLPTAGQIAFGTTVPGAAIWLGCWIDGMPWRYATAVAMLAAMNFFVFLLALEMLGKWGLAWIPAFALFGYRLAGVLDGTAQRAAMPSAPRRWSPGQPNTPPMPPSTPAAAQTNPRAYTQPRFGRQ